MSDNLSSSSFAGVTVIGRREHGAGEHRRHRRRRVASLPNGGDGIRVLGGDRNLIGGTEGEDNLVSGNMFSGVRSCPSPVTRRRATTSRATDRASAWAPRSPTTPASRSFSPTTTRSVARPTTPATRSPATRADGVMIWSNSHYNAVQGNWIGTDETGLDLGNGESGVEIDDAANNRVGATSGQHLVERHRPQRRRRRRRRDRHRQRDRAQLAP